MNGTVPEILYQLGLLRNNAAVSDNRKIKIDDDAMYSALFTSKHDGVLADITIKYLCFLTKRLVAWRGP